MFIFGYKCLEKEVQMDYNKQLERVINYFKKGETDSKDFTVGLEFEHFVLDKSSLKSISYYGENGLGETLLEICKTLNAKPYYNNESILGCDTDKFSISLEPGAQFEISIKSKLSIEQLYQDYKEILGVVLPIFAKKNQILVPLGYNPVSKIQDIKLIPKIRYNHMFEHFNSLNGDNNMGWNMMKGTASVQVTIDYSDEKDCIRKYFLASAIAPILYAAFDNGYIFEEEPYKKYNIRQMVWEKTDKSRSGLLDFAFDDMSYQRYAKFILDTTPIFVERNGEIISVNKKPFKELFDPENDSDDEIFHAISIVFPDVRLKTYLEFRMMDGVNYPTNFAIVALIKGLFYSKDSLNALEKMFEGTSYSEVMDAKSETLLHGLKAKYKGITILEHLENLYNLAYSALGDEAHFLSPIKEIINSGKSPKDVFEGIFESEGLRSAIEYNRVDKNV